MAMSSRECANRDNGHLARCKLGQRASCPLQTGTTGILPVAKRGSILAETVLVMPLLMLLIFGVIQFALIWTAKQMTAYAAYCATRAIMVVPDKNGEKEYAAKCAAKVALSWMCLADKDHSENQVSIPGWGKIFGSGSLDARLKDENDEEGVRILESGEVKPVAAVRVSFRFPLMIPGMAVNKLIGNLSDRKKEPKSIQKQEEEEGYASKTFYDDLHFAAGRNRFNNPDFEDGGRDSIDGWPYIILTETCVLPMPYSTANFPTGGFSGTSLTGGGS